MAKGSAKRIHSHNQTIVKRLLLFVLLSTTTYLVGNYLGRGAAFFSLRNGNLLAFFATTAVSLFCYWQLRSLGASQLSADGRRVELSGFDLDGPGLHQYMMDYIYITSAVHVLLPLTATAWFLFLVIPAYGIYLLLGHLRRK